MKKEVKKIKRLKVVKCEVVLEDKDKEWFENFKK